VSATKSARPAASGGIEAKIPMLRDRALAAMEHAYAPYSNFRVGAALLSTDGAIFDGCNVENAAYPSGICAEHAALASAVVGGARRFDAIAIATEADEPTPPCGKCRQVLEEFSPHMVVVTVTRNGREARWSLDELLPKAFTTRSLERR